MASRTERDQTERALDGAREPGDVLDRKPAVRAGERLETIVISVDLPEPVRAVPDDEVAVAIDDVAVNPGAFEPEQTATTSVEVIAPRTPRPGLVPGDSGGDAGFTETTYSRRDRLRGEPANTPEPAAMLTADRLLGTGRSQRPRPEGRWPRFVHTITFGAVNLGDSAAVRQRKLVEARIHKELDGGTRFVPVLTRKGGVGKTTVTTLLGMALADVREDRVIAIDANPDRGTLAERVTKQTKSTVRDVVTRAASISSFSDFTHLVSRDETRLDILASDTDPLLSEAFDEDDYNVVADLCARYYSIALTDCGTGIVHSVMRATLQRADSIVVVSGGSVDEARLASETLTWLEANGYGELVRNAVVALNTATQGTNLVKMDEIEAHFRSRVRDIVRIPYDSHLAAGSIVHYDQLKPLTRDAARELAALVLDGLPSDRPDWTRMTERQIRVFGDPVLKTASDAIDVGDPHAGALIADLLDTVAVPGRAGVAACQIGVSLRAFSYNVDGAIGYVINPVLAEVGGEPDLVDEGCLSVPGFSFPRRRYPFARVTGVDLDGRHVELSGEGLMAQALQHETDHLDGRLFIDALAPETKREAMRQIRESDWF